jgi:hypothetical protein
LDTCNNKFNENTYIGKYENKSPTFDLLSKPFPISSSQEHKHP